MYGFKGELNEKHMQFVRLRETNLDVAHGRIPLDSEKVLRESEKRNKIDYPFLENFPDEVYFYNR